MASSTRTGSPAVTWVPDSTIHFTTEPPMLARRVSGSAATADAGRAERPPTAVAASPAAPRSEPAPAGPPSPRSRPSSSPAGRPSAIRRPSTSMLMVCRGASGGTGLYWGSLGSSSAKSAWIQPVCTPSRSVAVNAGEMTTARWNGNTVGRPVISNSAKARRARRRACCRSAPVTISLASRESNWPGTMPPALTPESTRMPGPVGTVNVATVPGQGRKPRPTSSALIRNSKECPRGVGSASTGSGPPDAIWSWASTRSTPLVSSVIGCSTCSRVLTSRNEIVPSCARRYSTVPAPV